MGDHWSASKMENETCINAKLHACAFNWAKPSRASTPALICNIFKSHKCFRELAHSHTHNIQFTCQYFLNWNKLCTTITLWPLLLTLLSSTQLKSSTAYKCIFRLLFFFCMDFAAFVFVATHLWAFISFVCTKYIAKHMQHTRQAFCHSRSCGSRSLVNTKVKNGFIYLCEAKFRFNIMFNGSRKLHELSKPFKCVFIIPKYSKSFFSMHTFHNCCFANAALHRIPCQVSNANCFDLSEMWQILSK